MQSNEIAIAEIIIAQMKCLRMKMERKMMLADAIWMPIGNIATLLRFNAFYLFKKYNTDECSSLDWIYFFLFFG